MTPIIRTKLAGIFASAFLLFVRVVCGDGVAVFKEHPFYSDKLAQPLTYSTFSLVPGDPFMKIVTGGKERVVPSTTFVAHIDVLSRLPDSITDEAEAKPLRDYLASLKSFAAKYEKSAQMLQPQITAVTAHIAKFEAGSVRYKGDWMSKDAYAAAKAREAVEIQQAKERAIAMAEALKRKMEQEAAFAEAQRAKGLKKFNGQWLPRAEVARLQADANIRRQAANAVDSKTVTNAVFSIFQALGEGALIRIYGGTIQNAGINTDFACLAGLPAGMFAEGDRYKQTLYWCGTYTYENKLGDLRTVNRYCVNREVAIQVVMGPDQKESDTTGETGPMTRTSSGPGKTPEPLIGVSSCGSGFFVGNAGYFVTCAHVVHDCKQVAIFFNGQKIPAEVVKTIKAADLALLKVDRKVDGLPLLSEEATPGQDVFAIGYPNPAVQGLEVKVTKGVISSGKGLHDDDTEYQIDAAVQPGNSGGPLCDSAGRVAGLIVSKLDSLAVARATGSLPQTVNYAIKSSEIMAMLRSRSVEFDSSAGKGGLPKDDPIKTASSATGLVLVP